MSLEKIVSLVSIVLSFIVAWLNPGPFLFIVPCVALILFGFLSFIEKKESKEVENLTERIKLLEEKVSIHVAFGGKR